MGYDTSGREDVGGSSPVAVEQSAITRDQFLGRAAAAAGSLTILSAFFPAYAQAGDSDVLGGASKKFVFSSWGGSYSQIWRTDFTQPFARATGINVVFDDAPGEFIAKLQAQKNAGSVQWSLMDLDAPSYIAGLQLKLLQPLPAKLHAKLSKISYPGFVTSYGLGQAAGASQMIIANRDTLKNIPTTPADFWDTTNFPGRRAMWADGYFEGVWSALIADGVPPSKIFPLDLNRAFNKLDALKPNISVFYTSGDQQQQIMLNKEVDMEFGWEGRAAGLKYDDNLNVNLSYNGGFVEPNYLAIPVNAPDAVNAEKFISYVATNPKLEAKWTVAQGGYTMSNPKFLSYMSAQQRSRLWTTAARRRHLTVLNVDKLSKSIDYAALKTRWYSWLQS